MKRDFKRVRETAADVVESISAMLDDTFCITSEGYEFGQYVFHIQQLSLPSELSMEFTLAISGDDLDRHFCNRP